METPRLQAVLVMAFDFTGTEDCGLETRAAGDKLQVAGNISASGTVTAKDITSSEYGWFRPWANHVGIGYLGGYVAPLDNTGALSSGNCDLGASTAKFKDAHFSGTVYANGSPLTRTRDLIETLSTLRNATKDEETLEGLRDAIGDAVGGLIEKFEAMQSTATQEISDE